MSAINVENLAYGYPGTEPEQQVKVFEDLDLQIHPLQGLHRGSPLVGRVGKPKFFCFDHG